MIQRVIKAYAVGQKPENAGTNRFIIEMPHGGQMLGAAFMGETLVVNAAVDPRAPKAIYDLVVARNDEPIPLLIGEAIGEPVETLMMPTPAGPQLLHIVQVLPHPEHPLVKAV